MIQTFYEFKNEMKYIYYIIYEYSLPSKIRIETLIERDQKFYRKLSIYLKLIFLAYQKL